MKNVLILILLDDKWLYMNNWLHGDVRQYDISNPLKPVLKGQLFLGGVANREPNVRIVEDLELDYEPKPVFKNGRRLEGAPQMLQLSLDGKRLYVSSSLYSPWDRQVIDWLRIDWELIDLICKRFHWSVSMSIFVCVVLSGDGWKGWPCRANRCWYRSRRAYIESRFLCRFWRWTKWPRIAAWNSLSWRRLHFRCLAAWNNQSIMVMTRSYHSREFQLTFF